MKVGILGTGDVGRSLGKGFVTLGHEVKLGGREAKNEKATAWANDVGPLASNGTFADAAAFGELIVLATHGVAYESVLTAAGAQNLKGKVVIDTTNPLDFSKGMPPSLAVGHTDSGGEQVQRFVPEARVVKAFNIVGNTSMFRPTFPDGPPDMLICGNDKAAKEQVTKVLHDFGWSNVTDLGSIQASRILEPLCIAWVLYGAVTGGWNHAFKIIKK
ncbi:MAG TPA: NAD(P)-binding domain-containing protein [Polyangiaceae bacterium]|jgi:predicted dinucleotide-binding enzyme|nr:NAD(P)-binding domain-containing protein [Polyangiaceae bacterium]